MPSEHLRTKEPTRNDYIPFIYKWYLTMDSRYYFSPIANNFLVWSCALILDNLVLSKSACGNFAICLLSLAPCDAFWSNNIVLFSPSTPVGEYPQFRQSFTKKVVDVVGKVRWPFKMAPAPSVSLFYIDGTFLMSKDAFLREGGLFWHLLDGLHFYRYGRYLKKFLQTNRRG